MTTDPLIAEVRETRHRISEECRHDLWKLYARYDALQREMKATGKSRFVSEPLASADAEHASSISN